MSNSKGFAPVVLLLYGSVVLLASFAGFLGYKEYQLKQKTLGIETTAPNVLSPSSIPTSAVTPTSKPNTNPIIDCPISKECGGGTRKMTKNACDNSTCCLFDAKCGGPKVVTKSECKQSTCCQIGNKWILYKNKSQCIKDQQALNQNHSPNTSDLSYIHNPLPSYPPCTIYYPALNITETYHYLTPEQCQKSKESLVVPSPIYQTSPSPTLTEEQPQIITDQIEQDIKHCKNEVNAYYNQQVRNCSIQYGGSSAEKMCIYAQNQERDKKLKECEQNP